MLLFFLNEKTTLSLACEECEKSLLLRFLLLGKLKVTEAEKNRALYAFEGSVHM